MIISFPLLRILLVSACHTPAVAVFIPDNPKKVRRFSRAVLLCERRNTRPNASNNPSNHHLRNTKRSSLYHSTDCNHCTTNNHLTRSSEYITRPDGGHGAHKTAEIVHGGHCRLHVGGWVVHCFEEVFAYDDVAKYALLRISPAFTTG